MTIDERNQLALENDKLIHMMAKKYKGLATYEDLYQEGFLALLRACENFDGSGSKFSTYACAAINNAMKRYVINSSCIHIPEYMNEKMLKLAEAVKQLEAEGITPNKEVIAVKMGIPELEAAELLEHYSKRLVSSIDAVIQETGDSISELLSDTAPLVEDVVEEEAQQNVIYDAIKAVYGKKSADVIMYYRGIGCDSHTLQETGDKFNLTKEGVRQIVFAIESGGNSNKGKAKRRELKALLKAALY